MVMAGLLFLFAAPSRAQGNGPCHADVDRLCADLSPGDGRRLNCLRQHERELSAGCRQELSVTPAEPGASGSFEPKAGVAYPGKEEAWGILRLASGEPGVARLEVHLRALESNPEDMDALLGLRRTVWGLQRGELGRMRDADEPDAPGSASVERRRAYVRFLLSFGNGFAIDSCLRAAGAFDEGRYLVARDALATCPTVFLRPTILAHIEAYSERLERLQGTGKIAKVSRSLEGQRAALFQSLGKRRWSAALDALSGIRAGGPGRALAEELRALQTRLERHIRVEGALLRDAEGLLVSIEKGIDEDPAQALGDAEDAIAVAQIYGRSDLQARLRELARRLYFAAQSSADAAPRRTALTQGAPREPALSKAEKDGLQAELHYNRGLQAYLADDPERAAQEWRDSLVLDPRLEKSRKALARVEKEARVSASTGSEEP
jgi:hypothetical protein